MQRNTKLLYDAGGWPTIASMSSTGAPTPLQTKLAATPETARPGPVDAFVLARRKFRAAERIDMTALADELGINRVTLYRWVGTRDQLMVEVAWSLGEAALAAIEAQERATGRERVILVVSNFIEAVSRDPGMQRWLREEGAHALRLLTRNEPGFHDRLVERIERFLDDTLGPEAKELPAEPSEIALVIVSLIESMVHLDVIASDDPGTRRAEPILRLMLR
jgi:AcrR family transcriptional regulator